MIKPFSYKGFDFTSYDKEWWKGNAWVASRKVKCKNGGEARFTFLNELLPLIDRFSVISQCTFRFIANTYFIYKLTNNPEKRLFIHYVRSVRPTGLHFGEKEIQQLNKLDKVPNKGGLFFILEAANATTYYTRLTMLIMAVEGLAGEIRDKGQIRTDHESIKKILGRELWGRLYTYGIGLRNKLFHGNITDHAAYEKIADEIYKRIVQYLKNEFKVEVEENVVQPQRGFYGNFETADMFLGFKSEPTLELKTIEEAVDEKKSNDKYRELFEYLGNPKTSY